MLIRSKADHALTALFLFAAGGFLYCFLFIPPFLPVEGNGIGDNFLFLASGLRMFQGEMIYRDFFEFVPPGTALVNFLMFKLFGPRLWIPDLLALLLGIGLVWFGVVISQKLMRPGLTLLPCAIFLVSRREYMLDPSHHYYSVLAAMAAIAVLLEKRTPARIAVAGLLCGIGACFTQTGGLAVVVGFAVYLWWESRRRQVDLHLLLKNEAWLLTSFVAIFVAVNAYFIWKAGLDKYLWCTVVFVIKYFPKWADLDTFRVVWREFPKYSNLQTFLHPFALWLSLMVVVPFIFILFFGRYWREASKKPLEYWERPMLVTTVGLFMLLSIAPAPSTFRMAMIALPAFIMLGWLLDSPCKIARTIVATLFVGTLFAASYCIAKRRPNPIGILATPEGKLAFTKRTIYEEQVWIQQHTHPSEYFYAPVEQELYFTLDLRNPTPMGEVLNNGFTTQVQVSEVIQALEEREVRYILWSPQPDAHSTGENPSDAHFGPLYDYLHSHYQLVKVFPDSDEIWERLAGS